MSTLRSIRYLCSPSLILFFNQVPNPSVPALYEDALVYETGSAITSTGALTAYSGAKTGRSPLDKRIVEEPSSKHEIWWGPVNKPMTTDVSDSHYRPCVDVQLVLSYYLPHSHYCRTHHIIAGYHTLLLNVYKFKFAGASIVLFLYLLQHQSTRHFPAIFSRGAPRQNHPLAHPGAINHVHLFSTDTTIGLAHKP